MATARLMTFAKSLEYWLVPVNRLLLLDPLTVAGVLAGLLLVAVVLLAKELLMLPIKYSRAEQELIVRFGPKL